MISKNLINSHQTVLTIYIYFIGRLLILNAEAYWFCGLLPQINQYLYLNGQFDKLSVPCLSPKPTTSSLCGLKKKRRSLLKNQSYRRNSTFNFNHCQRDLFTRVYKLTKVDNPAAYDLSWGTSYVNRPNADSKSPPYPDGNNMQFVAELN